MIKNDNLKSIEYIGNSFFIKWYITDLCNYHCPYCLHANNNNRDKLYYFTENQKQIENKASKINNILVNNGITKPIWLRLMGGEATIFNIIPILENLSVTISNIGIVTNFYRPLQYFIDLYNYCKNRNISLHLTLSYHKENVEFFEKALELTKWCKDNGFKDPEINLVVTNDFNTTLVENYIEKGLWRIRALKVRGDYDVLDTTLKPEYSLWVDKINDNRRKHTKSNGKYLITYYDGVQEHRSSMSDFSGEFDQGGFIPDNRYCSIGKDAIFIRTDDNIYRTSCGYLPNNIIGNIYDEKVLLPKEGLICKLNENNPNKDYRCACGYHVNIGERIEEI